jgi:ADP-ribose pyrophosphatase YjhB (NUDIX family)
MRQRRRIAAYGVCQDEAGRVLLVRGADDGWSFPGGGVDHGEHPRNAVVRGFDAETGLAAEIVALRDVVAHFTINGDEVVHTDRVLYDVKVTGGTPRADITWADAPPGTTEPEIPAAEPVRDPAATRFQRFAAYGLTTDPTGRILLTRIAAPYPGAGTWHLPGGGTDFGEQPTEGLLRELVEETGQRGRVTGLRAVTHNHNARAIGPEGHAMDWHTVRALYRVVIDEPGTPSVVEAAGGSTAEARWFDRADLEKLPVNGFAKTAIAHHLG